MGASFAIKTGICALQKEYISLFWLLLGLLKEAMCTTKVSYPGLKAITTNFIFPTSLTCLVIRRAFSMV